MKRFRSLLRLITKLDHPGATLFAFLKSLVLSSCMEYSREEKHTFKGEQWASLCIMD